METDEPDCMAEFAKELGGLISLVAQRPNITLQIGADLHTPWSFNWKEDIVTANAADLRLRSRDYCRGLSVHEAAHAFLTRLWDIVPEALLEDTAVHHLLNVIEDCRLESWLQIRLPGCVPWVHCYNNLLFGEMLASEEEKLKAEPGTAFLIAILCRWWHGRVPEHMPESAQAALNEVWPDIQLAIAAAPPSECPDRETTRLSYGGHQVRVCYMRMDHGEEPAPMELEVRMAQHEMWEIVWRKILPVFRRLLNESGSPLSQLAEQMKQLRDLIQKRRCGQTSRQVGNACGQADSTKGGRQKGVFNWNDPRQSDYHKSLFRHHGAIEQITEALLRHMTAEVKMRCCGHHRSGLRMDIRQAMQYEADPHLHDQLWRRMSQPTRPDPAFVILADASGSMKGARAHATFDALVMLRESCLRLGLPLSILMFNSDTHLVQDWADPSCDSVLPRLCQLRNNPNGGTNLAGALVEAVDLLQELPQRHRHFWLLSDGEPENFEDARRQLGVLRQHSSSITALGLGPDTASLAKLVPSARINLRPSQLPQLAGRVFARMARVA
jgi:Mg-chelatase subunit ChlD